MMYQQGVNAVLQAAGLEKIAARAMDKFLKVVAREGNPGVWQYQFKGKPVAQIRTHPGASQAVAAKILDPAFEGMGLGKKLYGEVARRQPNTTLLSDDLLSPYAARNYERMRADPSYTTWKHPDMILGGYAAPTKTREVERMKARLHQELQGRRYNLTPGTPEFESKYHELQRQRRQWIIDKYTPPRHMKRQGTQSAKAQQYGVEVEPDDQLPAYAVSLPPKAQIEPGDEDPAWVHEMFAERDVPTHMDELYEFAEEADRPWFEYPRSRAEQGVLHRLTNWHKTYGGDYEPSTPTRANLDRWEQLQDWRGIERDPPVPKPQPPANMWQRLKAENRLESHHIEKLRSLGVL